MPELTEPAYISDVVAFEEDNFYSRDTVTILTGQGVLALGTVLAALTVGGKFVIAVDAGADGSENAVAVLLEEVNTTDGDVDDVIVLKRHSTVKRPGLVFGPAIDNSTKQAAAEAQLKAVGILTGDGA